MGRVRKTARERLAELLAAQGLRVEPSELRSAEGYQRINKATLDDDVVTWECWAHGAWGTYTKHVVSYDTMTACVRRGFTLDEDHRTRAIWVHARPAELVAVGP